MALGIAALISMLTPLLMAGGSAVGSYFGSRGKGSPAQPTPLGPQGIPQGSGMKAMDGFSGQPPSVTDVPGGGRLTEYSRQNPQQQQLLSQLLEQLSGQMGQGGQDPIAAQARKQFDEVSLPGLLHRFTAQGSTLQGSGVRDAILRAQTDFEGNLAGRKYNMLQNLMGTALQPQQEQSFTPKEPSDLMRGATEFGGPLLEKLSYILPFIAAKYGLNTSGGA